ncbi:MopE-related protein [Bacteroidota bacterium]
MTGVMHLIFWSLIGWLPLWQVQAQEITTGEYFFNIDPGPGNGQSLSFTQTAELDQSFDIDVTSVPTGFNILGIRFQDLDGMWSPSECRVFYILPEPETLPGGSNILVYFEYYFDADPGVGNGTGASISQADSISEILELPVTGLEPGFHTFSIRYKDYTGRWSPMESNMFYIFPEPLSGSSSKLVQYEYYFDADPGIGNGTGASFSQADSVNEIFEIPVTGLESGFHTFSIRYKDNTDRWSPMESRIFYVVPEPETLPGGSNKLVYYEYYFDADPGVGNGTGTSISQADSVSEIFEVPVTGLEPGFHTFSIRYKDYTGRWSPMESHIFYIFPEPQPGGSNKLVQYEYYFDADPGIGNGTGALITQADSVSQIFEVSVIGLETGFHTFSIRYKDITGHWSPMESRVFYISQIPASSGEKPDIIAMEYYVGDDPGLGNGYPVSLNVSPDTILQDTVLIDITGLGLPEGDYTLSIRALDELGTWSLMESRPFTYCLTAATYYADVDGDSFGDLLEDSLACSQPVGYVSNFDDCDDNDDQVNIEVVTWYYDWDNDGYGTPDSSQASCPHPENFVLNSDDCNDADSLINPFTKWYPDNDHDGYSTGTPFVLSCVQPAPGYVLLTGDCDDNDSTLNPLTTWYYDGDGDGLGDPNITETGCTQPGGNYVRNGDDCHDGDELIGAATAWYRDWDQDGLGNPDSVMFSCTMPAGYIFNGDDCDDTDSNIGSDAITWYVDQDNDGFGYISDSIFTCLAPSGYVSNKDDCNDSDSLINPLTMWYHDTDEDTFGDPGDTIIACIQPTGYVRNYDDCDDNDDRVNTEDINWYYDGDKDGYGTPDSIFVSCPQPDNYVFNSDDCNDNDSLLNPLTSWYLDTDNDGYGNESTFTQSCDQPGSDYVLQDGDCDDNDSTLNPQTTWHYDGDSDGFGDPNTFTIECVKPDDNYVMNGEDCDDGNENIGSPITWFYDFDQDGFGNPDSIAIACTNPGGFVDNQLDCDDSNDGIEDGITWYADDDGDSYGDPIDTLYDCLQPDGYTDNMDDCNDADSLINPLTIWYRDSDEDGFGNDEDSLVVCIQPDGYILNDSDCNDQDIEVSGMDQIWFADADEDGYGSMVDSLVSCYRPEGYILDNEDCDDFNDLLTPFTVWYPDSDGDGYGIRSDSIIACSQPENYVLNTNDCNDTDSLINPSTIWYRDADEDGFGYMEDTIITCIQPDGYILDDRDCNDQDIEVSGMDQTWFADADGDGYGSMVDSLISCDRPEGYLLNNDDCDDHNSAISPVTIWYPDSDGDGYGIRSDSIVACSQPENYVLNTDDCDDTDNTIIPLSVWFKDLDGDEFGDSKDSIIICNQPDGYILNKEDCDDTDQNVYPGAIALPDGKDNDCDGIIDLARQTVDATIPNNIGDTTTFVDLEASASSGLPVNIEVDGPAHLDDGILVPDGPGKVIIKIWQPGNEFYHPSDTLEYDFCIDPSPNISVEIGTYTILISNYKTGNQWYFNGNHITDADDSLYVVLQSGLYSLEVDIGGCNSFSEAIPVTVSGGVGEDPLQLSLDCPNKICLNQSDSLFLSVTGGVPPYQLTFKHRKFLSPDYEIISKSMFPEDEIALVLNSSSMDVIGMAYNASVEDSKGEQVSLNETYIGWYFTDQEEVKLPLDAFGGTLHDYRIFSIPYILEDNLISSIFEPSFGAYDKTKWRLVHYQNNGDANAGYVDYQAGINRIETGKGYWFNALTSQEIKLGVGEINLASPYTMKLEPGWNQIGNPYNIPIYWNTILADSKATDLVSELFVYEPSIPTFKMGNEMNPFEGGFVWANEKLNLTISPGNQVQGGRIATNRINAGDIDKQDWLVPLQLEFNGEQIEIGGIGMHPNASDFKDPYDIMAIPRFNAYLDLYTKHPGYFYPWFSTDVVPSQSEYSWMFRLESNFVNGPVSMRWDNTMMSESQSQLYLIDNLTGNRVDMKTQDSHTIDLQDSQPFTIYYFNNPSSIIVPDQVLLGNAYPNPAGKEVTIPILLSDDMIEYNIRLSVYDMNGREISTLVKGTLSPGFHEVNWDLLGENGEMVKAGVYLYRLSFGNDNYLPQQKRIIIQP